MQKIIHEYKNVNKLFDYIDKLYYETSNTDKPVQKSSGLIKQSYPSIFKGILDIFSDYGYEFDLPLSDIHFEPLEFKLREDAKDCVIVCISGGKDSTATTLHFIKEGYKVFLYHMLNVNKCYPDEHKRVQEIADYLDVPVFFDDVKVSGNHMYIEHPLKNFVLVDGAIHYALSMGISNIAIGDFQTATLENNAFEVSGGDCCELWDKYKAIIREIIPDFDLLMPLNSADDSLSTLLQDKHLLELSQSCMGTFRFREYKRQYNINKYGVKLMEHRCGSCWKCAVEYIYYADHDFIDYNKDYYKHCLDVLLMDMKANGLIPFTPEFIWYNYMGYDISESKISEELSHAIVQSRKIKYNSKEIAREVLGSTLLGD